MDSDYTSSTNSKLIRLEEHNIFSKTCLCGSVVTLWSFLRIDVEIPHWILRGLKVFHLGSCHARREKENDNSIDVVVAASALLNGDSLCCRANRELQVGTHIEGTLTT